MQDAYDEEAYLALHPDVAAAVSVGDFKTGREHYDRHGQQEGRACSRAAVAATPRENAVFHLIDRTGLGLEIGPSHNPMAPKRKGYNVHVVDHASADDLRKKYATHRINLDHIEEVDFVWTGQPLSQLVGRRGCYSWIIASHVIEHIPDLVSFLQECEKLLAPGGVLSLVVPDKRYCFDHFQQLSTTGVLLDAHAERRVRPSPGQVFDHHANAAKRGESIAWSAREVGQPDGLVHTYSDTVRFWKEATQSAAYTDVHCWRFTPESFQLVLSDLAQLQLTNLRVLAQFPTVGCEFYVSLGLGAEQRAPAARDRLAALATIHA